jgi:hypothetical protein
MVRRTTRWRIPPIKVLSLPTSQRIEFCYAFEGKAHYHGPLIGEAAELLLIDRERRTWWVSSPALYSPRYPVDADVDEGERVLGWRMPNGGPAARRLRHCRPGSSQPRAAASTEHACLPRAPMRGLSRHSPLWLGLEGGDGPAYHLPHV